MRFLSICAVLISLSHCASAGCIGNSTALDPDDCLLWQQLFDHWGGSSWIACNTTRNDPCSCIDQSGTQPTWYKEVTCTQVAGGHLRITKVQLPKNNLTGELVGPVTQLVALTWLGVYVNALKGTIPSAISNLAALRTLALEDNHLTGNLPSEIGALSRLNFIDVHGNRLSGLVPPLPFAQYSEFCSFQEPVAGGTNKFKCPLPATCQLGSAGAGNATPSCPACDVPKGGGIGPRCH
jgi:hypothetical protein